jgi:hypothetical protein
MHLGAMVNKIQISIIMYADDVIILSPTKSGIDEMLKKVLQYMTSWKIQINKKKTNFIIISKQTAGKVKILFDGEELEQVRELKYLGVIIDDKLNFKAHVDIKNKQNSKSCYSLYNTGFMGHAMNIETKKYIYETYCRPTLYYGWEFLPLNEKMYKTIRTNECALLKRILSIKKTTSNNLIYKTLKMSEPEDQIHLMKARLHLRLTENDFTNDFLKNLAIFGNENDKLGSDSLIRQIDTIKNNKTITNTELIDQIKKKIYSIESNGLIDSIIYCFDQRINDSSYNIKLHLLLTPYRHKIT